MERCAQFNSQPDDLALFQMDERCHDLDVSVFRAHFDELVERLVVRRPAVGIAGAVLLDGAYKDLLGPENLGPADRRREKVSIAKGDVGDGNLRANLGFLGWGGGYRASGVGEGGGAGAPPDGHPPEPYSASRHEQG